MAQAHRTAPHQAPRWAPCWVCRVCQSGTASWTTACWVRQGGQAAVPGSCHTTAQMLCMNGVYR